MQRSIGRSLYLRCIITNDMKYTINTLKSKRYFVYEFDIINFLYVKFSYLCIHISKLRIMIKASESMEKHVIMILMSSANT